MKKALLVIDVQNDYFPEGQFPLWNTENTLKNIQAAQNKAQAQNSLVVHIQHIADPALGLSPFFNAGTVGAEIHPELLQSAPDAPVVQKHFADSFEQTELASILADHQIEELFICGMMTQNCVSHTAISKAAEKYKVTILTDCCTTVDEMIHNIALHAVSTRVSLLPFTEALT